MNGLFFDQDEVRLVGFIDGTDEGAEVIEPLGRFPETLERGLLDYLHGIAFRFVGGGESSPFRVQGDGSGNAFQGLTLRQMNPDAVAQRAAPMADEVVLTLSAGERDPLGIGIDRNEKLLVAAEGIC